MVYEEEADCVMTCMSHAKMLCELRRQSELEAKARDVRLQRALEEVERFRSLLQEQRAADKDNKDVSKADFNRVLTGAGSSL